MKQGPQVSIDGRAGRIRLVLAVIGALALSALLPATAAQAEGPNAVRNLAGCTSNTLAANDDGSTGLVNIGFSPDFFGNGPVTQLYVNNNGNVTVGGPVSQFTPFDFTTGGDVMIAPFLADVDTNGAPGNGALETKYGTTTVGGHAAFCVNWVDVGYFASHVDKKNSFQLLLIDRSDVAAGAFDIEFNYDKIQWETGDASSGTGGLGGTSAAVGYANGDGEPSHFFVRDGSFENGALLNGGGKALIGGTLNAGGQLGRYVFAVRNLPPTGATITGEVDDPAGPGNPVSGAPVEICRTAGSGGGPCVARLTNASGIYRAINLPAGDYNITAHAGDGPEYADGQASQAGVTGTNSYTKDITLGDELGGPPAGTTITDHDQSPGGVPVLLWDEPSTLTTTGCPGAAATYTLKIDGVTVASGAMTESPSGTYTATIPPVSPNHGDAQVHIALDCPPGPPDEIVDFGVYIDPSGFVRTTAGVPIAGAQVTLFRSADADGPFIQVPNGHATMSPSNRQNPDATDGAGHFGWDVIAGFYKVRASADGCGSVSSGVLTIPPPVTDLDLRLNCTPATQPLAAPKKCKKGQKLKKGKCVKKKKKKGGKKSIVRSYSWDARGVLEAGASGAK